MTSEPPPPPARLADALKRLEAELVNRDLPADEQTRALLLDRIARIRMHVSVEALERSTSDPEASSAMILALLQDWVKVLERLRRLDQEASATRH